MTLAEPPDHGHGVPAYHPAFGALLYHFMLLGNRGITHQGARNLLKDFVQWHLSWVLNSHECEHKSDTMPENYMKIAVLNIAN